MHAPKCISRPLFFPTCMTFVLFILILSLSFTYVSFFTLLLGSNQWSDTTGEWDLTKVTHTKSDFSLNQINRTYNTAEGTNSAYIFVLVSVAIDAGKSSIAIAFKSNCMQGFTHETLAQLFQNLFNS